MRRSQEQARAATSDRSEWRAAGAMGRRHRPGCESPAPAAPRRPAGRLPRWRTRALRPRGRRGRQVLQLVPPAVTTLADAQVLPGLPGKVAFQPAVEILVEGWVIEMHL